MNNIDKNTYVSLGLLVVIIGATWVLASSINGATTSINSFKSEWTGRMKSLEDRVATTEKNKESWTDGDMFRWAVHLQKENPSLKVPEPENHSGR